MTTDKAAERARSLRSQSRIARAAMATRGRTWDDYDRVAEIADEMDAEAADLERLGTASEARPAVAQQAHAKPGHQDGDRYGDDR